MFPWDRKSQTNFRAKKNYHRASSNGNDHSYTPVAEQEQKSNKTIEHLPRLKQYHKPPHERETSFQGQSSGGINDFYNYQRQEDSQLSGKSKYPRSFSYTPFEEKIVRAQQDQQKNYAKMLDEQIKAKSMRKANDKINSMEIEKKLINGNDFYRHFDSKFADCFIDKTSVTITENSPNKFVKNLSKKNQAEGRASVGSYQPKGSPLKGNDQNVANYSSVRENLEDEDVMLNEKTIAYIKKLEYKKELEQQMIEQNLKKKHEREMRLLEEKLEEMKYSYTRLKTKNAHEGPGQQLEGHSSFEKSPPKPKFSKEFEVLVKPTEPSKPEGEGVDPTSRKPSFVRKIVPQENKSYSESKTSKVKPSLEQPIVDLAVESIMVEKNPAYSKTEELEGNMWSYMQIQNELGRMRSEFKDYMHKINDKIANLKSDFTDSYKVDNEILKNKEFLHFQVIKEYPRLVATPFNINANPVALQVPTSVGLSTTESKQSLIHDTQFVPLNEALSRPNPKYVAAPVPAPITVTVAAPSNLSTTRISPVSTSKSENDDVSNKMIECAPLIDNMVNLTKKLEESVNTQQQKISKEMGDVRGELKNLKRNGEGPKILIHEPPETKTNLEEKSSFSQTSNENSIVIDENRQKMRRKSQNALTVKKGVKRNREEMLADSKKK